MPTVHRTLEPLCYDKAEDGTLVPKEPEVILGLKVCDPACGSASFLVAALHYLADALYRSLCHHRQLDDPERARRITLPYGRPRTGKDGDELVPFPPDDPKRGHTFEERVKALLRRHVVERCIYGVDINPLAVELSRVSLWIETLDPDLPFSFLDHKIKVGNALVGCWLDRVEVYPLKAWEREGGDGPKGERTGRIETFLKGEKVGNRRSGDGIIKREMRELIEGRFTGQPPLFPEMEVSTETVVAQARAEYEKLHALPPHTDPDERERIYREHILGSPAIQQLKRAMDEWCAVWFWPTDVESLKFVPTPLTFHDPTDQKRTLVERLADELRFFHWELEFPDVFMSGQSGFDTMLGNPPWENAQPNPYEFFADHEPTIRTFGRNNLLACMEKLFHASAIIQDEWLEHCGFFKSFANWVTFIADPFGLEGGSAILGRGSSGLVATWKKRRQSSKGFVGSKSPFRYQMGRVFTYKLFLESSNFLLGEHGRLGMIVPAGLYTDSWSLPLRQLFLDHSNWEWLFSFENKLKIFNIHSSFKFSVVIVARPNRELGSHHTPLRAAFMVHDLGDWERADPPTLTFDPALVPLFSPRSKSLPEVRTERDLTICRKIYDNSIRIGDKAPEWEIKFGLEFMMNTDVKLFPLKEKWEEGEYRPDRYGRWVGPNGNIALPLYEGRMIGQFDFSQKGWVSGKGRSSVWRDIPYEQKLVEPQFLMAEETYVSRHGPQGGLKLAFMDITSGTNVRTMISTAQASFPCGNSVPILSVKYDNGASTLLLSAVTNSLSFDFTVRQRIGGLHLNWFIIEECPIPVLNLGDKLNFRGRIVLDAARLTLLHRRFAPEWLKLKRLYPELAGREWKHWWAVTEADRLRLRVEIDALCADLYGLDPDDFDWIVRDDPTDPKGFYRVDKQFPFRERLTGLAAAAFRALKDGRWSAESAASLSNDEFFALLGIPELTSPPAAHALGLPGPLIEKRPGCHVWTPENFLEDDPRYGWTWDDCWKDAVALLGSEEAVRTYLEDSSSSQSNKASLDDGDFRLVSKPPSRSQGKLF
ncbi:Eco57I restriction-modification methylase domain-containing protein [Tautonia plasticadhaerens]|uniref:site-specific DNA-methyltransferase (adenine-specific) n=1 Tax=Tautonia plasticadhaerens TaxID=2527974 RepID=A0A518H9Z1_9BACT|nr:hypothetical protein [Tautonia plasticadhaerens]QDV37672.1 hypothetical protein ElP_56150 [Tautonia plasticadhaerens]